MAVSARGIRGNQNYVEFPIPDQPKGVQTCVARVQDTAKSSGTSLSDHTVSNLERPSTGWVNQRISGRWAA